MKIKKATEEQWREIEKIRERWISEQTREVPFEDVLRSVKYAYSLVHKDKSPLVFHVDGPYECALASLVLDGIFDCRQQRHMIVEQIHTLNEQLNEQVIDHLDQKLDQKLGSKMYSEISIRLDEQLRSQLREEIFNKLFNEKLELNNHSGISLGDNFYDKLYSRLRSKLYDMFNNQLDWQIAYHLCQKIYNPLSEKIIRQMGNCLKSQIASAGGQIGKIWTCCWWQVWAAFFEGGALLGVKYDQDKYDNFNLFCRSIPLCMAAENVCVVSKWPISVKWDGDRLHNDTGPSVEFRDGFKLWSINGWPVDEQVVMRPETQTIHQIDAEENGDIRSIRIERFGWPRYLKETRSVCRDTRKNDVEGTIEALYSTDKKEQRLVVTCPTGRVFALGVPSEVKTCEAAQNWLSGGKRLNVIART